MKSWDVGDREDISNISCSVSRGTRCFMGYTVLQIKKIGTIFQIKN